MQLFPCGSLVVVVCKESHTNEVHCSHLPTVTHHSEGGSFQKTTASNRIIEEGDKSYQINYHFNINSVALFMNMSCNLYIICVYVCYWYGIIEWLMAQCFSNKCCPMLTLIWNMTQLGLPHLGSQGISCQPWLLSIVSILIGRLRVMMVSISEYSGNILEQVCSLPVRVRGRTTRASRRLAEGNKIKRLPISR